MFALASVLFIYEAFYLVSLGASLGVIVLAYCDVLTKAMPIGLVVCLVVSTFVSSYRLRFSQIRSMCWHACMDVYVRVCACMSV